MCTYLLGLSNKLSLMKGKGTSEVHSRTGHGGPEGGVEV